jgi:hypothetical protein
MASPPSYQSLRPTSIVNDQTTSDYELSDACSVGRPQNAAFEGSRSVRVVSRSHQSRTILPSRWSRGRNTTTPTGVQNLARLLSAEYEHANASQSHLPKTGWWSAVISDTWYVEILAGCISLAAFGSIIGVLAYYDNKPAPLSIKGITVIKVLRQSQ